MKQICRPDGAKFILIQILQRCRAYGAVEKQGMNRPDIERFNKKHKATVKQLAT